MNSGAAPTVVAWGELVWDLLPEGPRLGGCAANVAYHAARLGNRAVLVSRVGEDPLGRAALSILAAAGVDVSLVAVDRDAPTGSVRVDLRRDEPRYELVTQAAWNRIELNAGVAAAMGAAAVICYAALAQQTALCGDALDAALAAGPPSCVRLCDLNLRSPSVDPALIAAALAGADAVKLNRAEAALLAGTLGVDDPARYLIDVQRVGLVALTDGSAGSLLTTAAERVEQPGAVAKPGGDGLGAGDAFTAVLAHHLARRSSVARMAAAAGTYAAHVASSRGAMPDVPAEVLLACA